MFIGHSISFVLIFFNPLEFARIAIKFGEFDSGISANLVIGEDRSGPDETWKILGVVKGLTPTAKFGFHIHEYAFTDNDCSTAGSHFNPTSQTHGYQVTMPSKRNLPEDNFYQGLMHIKTTADILVSKLIYFCRYISHRRLG